MLPDPDTFDPDNAEHDGLYGLPHTPDDAAVVVIPVPWEATASYRRGTSGAPRAIAQACLQVDLHDAETGGAWKRGIAMEPLHQDILGWNAQASAAAMQIIRDHTRQIPGIKELVNRLGVTLNDHVEGRCAHRLAQGQIPAILGGDHSVAFGAIKAAAQAHPGLGVLQIDAHADLRQAYLGFTWSHASVFYNVLELVPEVARVVQVGVRDQGRSELKRARDDDRVRQFSDPDLGFAMAQGESWGECVQRILADLPQEVWLSVDIDGLEPNLCPGTGTPVPGGLSWQQLNVLLRLLVSSGRRVVGFDLCEVGTAQWDAIVGARALYKLSAWALRSQEA